MFKRLTLRGYQRQCQIQNLSQIATRPLSSTPSLCKLVKIKGGPNKLDKLPPVPPKTPSQEHVSGQLYHVVKENTHGVGKVAASEAADAGLPSVAILESARLSRALTISSEKALSVLQEFIALGPVPLSTQVRALLDKHELQPSIFSQIARILVRCPKVAQRSLGRTLLFSGTALRDSSCTLEVMQNAIKFDALSRRDMVGPRKHLLELARDNLPEAQFLQGHMCEVQGAIKEAMGWYRLAMDSTQTSEPLILGASQHDAYVRLGLLLKNSSPEEAKEVFRKAALEYDNPIAYYHLAQFEAPSSENREIYLLKAASSGVLEATRNLGVLYFEKAMEKETAEKQLEGVSLATDWFLIGAEARDGYSMVKLGLIMGFRGEDASLYGWLNRAAALEGMEQPVNAIKAKLQDPEFDGTQFDWKSEILM